MHSFLLLLFFLLSLSTIAEFIPFEAEIPKIVHQTYHDFTRIPSKVRENIAKFASGYELRLWSDMDCQKILKDSFSRDHEQLFVMLQNGAHRADLCRYAVLYVHGGIYIDIKTEPLVPFDYIFRRHSTTFSILSIAPGLIFNGVIASPKGNPIFLEMMDFMIAVGRRGPSGDYNYNCRKFFDIVARETERPQLLPGLNVPAGPGNQSFYMFQEARRSPVECYDGLDRYGYCVFAFLSSGEKVFKIRYADYHKW